MQVYNIDVPCLFLMTEKSALFWQVTLTMFKRQFSLSEICLETRLTIYQRRFLKKSASKECCKSINKLIVVRNQIYSNRSKGSNIL